MHILVQTKGEYLLSMFVGLCCAPSSKWINLMGENHSLQYMLKKSIQDYLATPFILAVKTVHFPILRSNGVLWKWLVVTLLTVM